MRFSQAQRLRRGTTPAGGPAFLLVLLLPPERRRRSTGPGLASLLLPAVLPRLLPVLRVQDHQEEEQGPAQVREGKKYRARSIKKFRCEVKRGKDKATAAEE